MNPKFKKIAEGLFIGILMIMSISYIKIVFTHDEAIRESMHTPKIKNANTSENINTKQTNDLQTLSGKILSPNIENINIEPMQELSGKSREEIFDIRKEAVATSPIFKNLRNYHPSEEVFRIEDGLQWIAAKEVACKGTPDNPYIGRGPSRESVGILNPELLYYINIPTYHYPKNQSCSVSDYLIPYRAYYTPKTNTITALIKYRLHEKFGHFVTMDIHDANARDLGYNFGYADKVENIEFETDKFQTKGIHTVGYYHRGYACRLQEGCNNYSPSESGYEFAPTKLPARVHFKLWAQKPASLYNKADINYEMIFE